MANTVDRQIAPALEDIESWFHQAQVLHFIEDDGLSRELPSYLAGAGKPPVRSGGFP
jgi:hypothetical protein